MATSNKMKAAYVLSGLFIFMMIIALVIMFASTKMIVGVLLFVASWIPMVVALVLFRMEGIR